MLAVLLVLRMLLRAARHDDGGAAETIEEVMCRAHDLDLCGSCVLLRVSNMSPSLFPSP